MHPTIKEFYREIELAFPVINNEKQLFEVLEKMSRMKLTLTEASLVLVGGYGISDEQAEEIVLNSKLFSQSYVDIMKDVVKYSEDENILNSDHLDYE